MPDFLPTRGIDDLNGVHQRKSTPLRSGALDVTLGFQVHAAQFVEHLRWR